MNLDIRRIPVARTRPGRLLYQRVLLAPHARRVRTRRGGHIDRILLMDSYVPLLRAGYHLRYASLVHDVLPLTHPGFWSASKAAIKRTALRSLLAARATIFTSTDYNARLIERLVGRPARVVRFGCGQLADAEADAARDAPLPIRSPYVVYVGAFEPRKNILMLIDAFDRGMLSLDGETELVLVGDGRRQYAKALEDAILRSPNRERFRVVSGANRDVTLALIAQAAVLVLPSLAEGFGLPLIEALALGTPAVASDLPEIRSWAGATIEYASPVRPSEWLEAIEAAALASDETRRRGQLFAQQFRWNACAQELSDF